MVLTRPCGQRWPGSICRTEAIFCPPPSCRTRRVTMELGVLSVIAIFQQLGSVAVSLRIAHYPG